MEVSNKLYSYLVINKIWKFYDYIIWKFSFLLSPFLSSYDCRGFFLVVFVHVWTSLATNDIIECYNILSCTFFYKLNRIFFSRLKFIVPIFVLSCFISLLPSIYVPYNVLQSRRFSIRIVNSCSPYCFCLFYITVSFFLLFLLPFFKFVYFPIRILIHQWKWFKHSRNFTVDILL
mgnify:CR=1 FL=1